MSEVLDQGFRAGIMKWAEDVGMPEDVRDEYAEHVESQIKVAGEVRGYLLQNMDKKAAAELRDNDESTDLDRLINKLAQNDDSDSGGGDDTSSSSGAGPTAAEVATLAQNEPSLNYRPSSSDLTPEAGLSPAALAALMALLGGGVGFLNPYLSGAEPAEGWKRHIPTVLGAGLGGLTGYGLSGGFGPIDTDTDDTGTE